MLTTLAVVSCIIANAASLRCTKTRCVGLKVEDILSSGYDKGTPPSKNGNPAEVEINASVLNIRAVNEKTMSFYVDIFLHQRWTDDRLIFPKNISSSSSIILNAEWRPRIWTPDIFFKNSLEGKVQDIIIPYTYMRLFNNKTVFFASRLSLQLSCEMNLRKFPHDTQQCDIAMMALIHTAEEMTLHWSNGCGIMITRNVLLPQFDVINTKCGECTRGYEIGSFSCINATITLKRRTGYYTIHVYIPSILIVAMSMLTFWMPQEAVPARVTLGVTTLLTIVTIQFKTSLPSVSYVVAMNIWMSCCIAFVFCSLLEFAVVQCISRHLKKATPQQENTPSFQMVIENQTTFTRSCLCSFGYAARIKRFFKRFSFDRTSLDKISRFVFPLGFICHIIIYWSNYGL